MCQLTEKPQHFPTAYGSACSARGVNMENRHVCQKMKAVGLWNQCKEQLSK